VAEGEILANSTGASRFPQVNNVEFHGFVENCFVEEMVSSFQNGSTKTFRNYFTESLMNLFIVSWKIKQWCSFG
jgi:hypothetical protein